MTRWRVLVPAIVVALAQSVSSAQAQRRPRREAVLPRAGVSRQLPESQPGAAGANRAQLEQRFQQMLYQMTRRRVGLSDEQMNKLVPINRSFERQRRDLQRQERETRVSLREAMRDSAQMDQGKISGYMDRLVQLQRQRADLLEQEQKDLAEFMTPLQRARYTALQEQVRRRMEQLVRQNRANADTSGVRPQEP